MQRNDSGFIAFGRTNGQKPLPKINIAVVQRQGFANPQPGHCQQSNNGAKGGAFDRVGRINLPGSLDELQNIIIGIVIGITPVKTIGQELLCRNLGAGIVDAENAAPRPNGGH